MASKVIMQGKFENEKRPAVSNDEPVDVAGSVEDISAGSQHLHRKLKSKEVQLFAIGAAIGTSLFVQMGSALPKGGPAGLFLGFAIWGIVMLAVNECFAEMVCYMPVASPFVRLGTEWVDEAFGFAMAWNFWLNMAFLVPFEIVAMNILLNYWTDKVPVEVVIVVIMVLYLLIHIISVRYFGIVEFWMSIFKVLLITGCILFTFITMVGGNPEHDRYGFRYWNDPGALVEHFVPGTTGRFLGVLSCMVQATFSITGPEYISMVAGETETPRKILPKAYRSFVFRILLFFVGSALCMGIVIPYNDPTLTAVLDGTMGGSGTGAASPYVIAMQRLHISSNLGSLVNALIMTSVFSSGNGLLFSATRSLHGMSLSGEAPRFLSICTQAGVPIYALLVSLAFCLLAFLQVSSSSADVINWLVDLVTCCQLINYFCVALTYRHFYAALGKQGVERDTLPYRGRCQPYASYVAMAGTFLMSLLLGYDVFITDNWSTMYFFLDYTMIGFFIVCFVAWKLVRKTRYVWPGTADLTLGGLKGEIDAYEAVHVPRPQGRFGTLLDKVF